MPLLKIENAKKDGSEKNKITLNFSQGDGVHELLIFFPEIKGENIEITPDGIYITIKGKRLYMSFCEPEPQFC